MRWKIWKIYFFKEILKTFFLLLFCFFGLYVLIDYASHSSHHYHHSLLKWKELVKHYINEFSLRAHVLIPFALLLATMRTVIRLNLQNELLALMAAGISIKTLIRPFLWVGLFLTLFLYVNTEYLLPPALKKAHHLRDEKLSQVTAQTEKRKKIAVQHIALKDQTVLLFQTYDSLERTFFDAYWICSFDEIWRIQYLDTSQKIPRGVWVDHLTRNAEGILKKEEWFQERDFPEMQFDKQRRSTLVPPEELSLSTLWKKLSFEERETHGKQAEWNTAFLYKLALPWLALFAVIAPVPFCLKRSRTLPLFFFYAFALFALTASFLFFSAGKELGNRQPLYPIAPVAS